MPVRLFSAAGPCPVLATWHQALYETAMHTYRIVNVFTMDGDRFSGTFQNTGRNPDAGALVGHRE